MTDLTPERRAELRTDAENRRLFRFVTGTASDGYPSSGYEPIDAELTALLDAADERDRLRQEKRAEQVERIKAEHLRIRVRGKFYCVVDEMEWPCHSIKNLESDTGGMTC